MKTLSIWITFAILAATLFSCGSNEEKELQRRLAQTEIQTTDKNKVLDNATRLEYADLEKSLNKRYIKELKELLDNDFEEKLNHFEEEELGFFASYKHMWQNRHMLWALSNEALYKLDIHTQKVEKITPADSVYLGLFTFCQDDAGNLWIGTIGNGLVKFDTATSKFISMQTVLQKNHYSIYSICYDNGCVWMGTDDGLFCYDTKSNRLVEFDKREGMQGQVYYPLAVMKGESGLLYFGGTEGFTVVNPKRISYNAYKPKAMISDFYVNHEVVRPDRMTESEKGITIVLNHDQSNFGFSFSADNYYIPERNRFRYRLKGYNNSWIVAGVSQRSVMFSKVPAGTYYFEICAGNNDGVWNEVPTVIKVIRKPAPWFSWWAWGLYALAVGVAFYFIFHHYAEKKRWKMLVYREHLEKEKKEQIHEAQLRFFTNISHDFRTPLSLILVVLDKLRREGLKEYYYRILNGNVQRLLNLVNELMDFRTVENGKMKLALAPVDVNSLIGEIIQDFTDYAEQRHVGFRWNLDGTLPANIFVDKNVLEKIVMNLLTNAFKYTHEGGDVVLETALGKDFQSAYKNKYVVGQCSENAFSFIVRDTGVGISEESIESVFERFYKVDTVNFDSHLGTGIGLALVKSLVLLHKGSVSIYSERGKGTDMVVCLPMDKTLFAPKDFAEYIKPISEEPAPAAETDPILDDEESMAETLLPSNLKKILLVEDNADLRGLIAESLSDEFHVIQAADGLEALMRMGELEFDLVLSDIMMPHKDGVSLCRDIKNNLETSHIPVALLTAKVGIDSKIEGADSGADFYFEKPIDLTYLKLSIRNMFRNRQQLKEYYAKNYYADSEELSTNEQDGKFLKHLVDFIDANMENSSLDVDSISKEMMMSRSKLYSKMKGLTGKSMVEFVLNYRMRKAARLILEEDVTMREVMMRVGIESQAYFTNSFKKVFGETPTSFAAKHKK